MKLTRLSGFVLLLSAGLLLADGLLGPKEFTKTNASATVPVRLKANRGDYFKRATIYGKLDARTNNTGIVYIGWNSTNDTQTVAINPGSNVVLEAPVNSFFDLYDIYLDVVTTNDGVVVVYEY